MDPMEQDDHPAQLNLPISSNPLKVDLILERLFSFCSSKTLENCRLVSKQWKNVSLKEWRNKAVLCPRKILENGNILTEYLQRLSHPYRNFRIEYYDFPEYLRDETNPISNIARHVILHGIKGDYVDLGLFLSSFHSLQILELRNCTWIWKSWCKEQPLSNSVKCLKIYQSNDSSLNKEGNLEFVGRLPNLESLSLECTTALHFGSNMAKFSGLASSIYSAKARNEIRLNLKELEVISIPTYMPLTPDSSIVNFVNMEFINPISKCNFPLERLVMHLVWDRTIQMKKVVSPLLSLLDGCSRSLQCLKTFFQFDIEDFMDFVFDECQKHRPIRLISALTPIRDMNIVMEALKHLELANGIWGYFLLVHLELPNLEKLTVEYGKGTEKANLQQYQMRHLTGKVFPRLETFELLDNHEIPGPERMTLFVNMMPNLIHLSAPLDKQAFQIVCEKYRGLRTLNILPLKCQHAALDDETLAGVAKDDDEEHPRKPNISNLTCLTDLTISSDSTFTDHAVIYGFLQLPRLYFLKATFSEISVGIKAKLTKHVTGSVQIQERSGSEEIRVCTD